jgi:predicted nucleotidyltransferase
LLQIEHSQREVISEELKTLEKNRRITAIVLIGSFSRGDYIRASNIEESDVEFYVIYRGICKPKISVRFCDISVISKYKLPFLEKNLINYEAKAFGKLIYGKDVIAKLPDINKANLNEAIIDEILLFRAYDISKDWSQQKFEKNLFYLLTWKQITSGLLLGGFESRYRHYINNISEDIYEDFIGLREYFDKWNSIRMSGLNYSDGSDLRVFYLSFYKKYIDRLFVKVSYINRLKQVKYIFTSDFKMHLKGYYIFQTIFGTDARKLFLYQFISELHEGCTNQAGYKDLMEKYYRI